MGNMLFVTVIDTLVVLFTSSLIGFVLSKYKFKLNKFLFYVILITMMMPTAAMRRGVPALSVEEMIDAARLIRQPPS